VHCGRATGGIGGNTWTQQSQQNKLLTEWMKQQNLDMNEIKQVHTPYPPLTAPPSSSTLPPLFHRVGGCAVAPTLFQLAQ
jgi:hypothetical protein